MSSFESEALLVAEQAVRHLTKMSKEKDVREVLIESANLVGVSGRTNLSDVLESFTKLATSAESEQVRSQTAIQYIKFLGKSEEGGDSSKAPLNLQININPIKGETIVE